jgi:pimeloyl-ACP methyl ester carboxylesterase
MLGPLMKKLYFAAFAALFLLALSPARASAFDSFGFYCNPYIRSFEEGKHYLASSTNPGYIPCSFNIPSAETQSYSSVQVGIFKGVVGNSQYVAGGNVSPFFPLDTSYSIYNVNFALSDGTQAIEPKQDDDFFAVLYDGGINQVGGGNPTLTQFINFFTNGSTPPNDHYKIIRWKWGLKPPSEWNPVIIIPGILGSWQNLLGAWVLDPMTHVYDNLIATLETNGYVENKTLFAFPYDWEKSNVDTAKLLAQKIADIKTICGCNNVDIVAHSMGGLVATQYIESADYRNDVDQLITLGTPLAGSPQVYQTWEAGQMDFDDPSNSWIMNRIFSRESADNGYSSVVSYIQNKPVASIRELLPISNYLKQGSSLLQYPTGYPSNPFLENLLGEGGSYQQNVFNRVRISVVIGDAGSTSTVTSYTVKPSTQLPLWKDGEPVATSTGPGDDRVPFDSATYFSGPDYVAKGAHHTNLASSTEAFIFNKLTGKNAASLVGKNFGPFDVDIPILSFKIAPNPSDFPLLIDTFERAFVKISGFSYLLVMLFSPIDVKITAPDGNQIGKDFSTGMTINQIPNAVYSGPIGEHEYVLIQNPLPGQYKVETVGTGNGAYTVAAGLINSATTSASLVSGTTTLNQIISNTLFVSSTSTIVALTPPPSPIATTTPTTSPLTPDTCLTDMNLAYKNKWVTRRDVYDNLVFDCKALVPLFKSRDTILAIPESKRSASQKLLLSITLAAIKLDAADMELLAKDKSNTKDAVSLINKYNTWLRNTQLP